MKFTKLEIKDFSVKIKQLKEEIITGRHILASLGSVGLTFTDDINRFKDYLEGIGEWGLLIIINDNRELTADELKSFNEDWR